MNQHPNSTANTSHVLALHALDSLSEKRLNVRLQKQVLSVLSCCKIAEGADWR
jgi:hypothetical protein